jgi:hypothetical protein
MSFLSFLGINKGPKPITPQLVTNLWAYMQKVYNTSVINKSDSNMMALVGTCLDKMGIQDKATFLAKYTTTIGHSIYTPFTVGTPTADWPLTAQIIVCLHEHQHVVQCVSEGEFSFNFNYLLKPDMRAKYETEAYRSTLELSWYYSKTLPDLHSVASILLSYGLTADHVHVAEVALASAARMIKAGLVLNQATKTGLAVL